MKLEVKNSGANLRGMRDNIDQLRSWISAFHTGITAAGGRYAPLVGFELHLGQTRVLLDGLMREAEKSELSKTTKKK